MPSKRGEIEIGMFGCTREAIEKAADEYINRFARTPQDKIREAGMLAMSMLSDSQELIAAGRTEEARQVINRAKYVISTRIRHDN